VVLDTNIWISGLLLPKSKAGNILLQWKASKIDILTSQPILDEIRKVLLYPKIQKRIQWDEIKVDQYVSLLQFLTDFISIDADFPQVIVECDKDDSIILNTFLASKADFLVTGDNDLLVLNQKYSIVTLSEFYDTI
jgi:putative PIN family toxin of toxin-antitoxin system